MQLKKNLHCPGWAGAYANLAGYAFGMIEINLHSWTFDTQSTPGAEYNAGSAMNAFLLIPDNILA